MTTDPRPPWDTFPSHGRSLFQRFIIRTHMMAFSHFLLWKFCVTKNAQFQLSVGVQFKDIEHVQLLCDHHCRPDTLSPSAPPPLVPPAHRPPLGTRLLQGPPVRCARAGSVLSWPIPRGQPPPGSRSIAGVRSPFLPFQSRAIFHAWTKHISLIPSLVDGHVDGVHLLATVNDGAMSIADQPLSNPFGDTSKNGITGPYGNSIFNFLRKPQSGETEGEERPEGVVGAVTGAGESRSA